MKKKGDSKELIRVIIWRTLCVILIVGSVLAAIKSIIVGLQMDEEYAISLSYRIAKGDRLFAEIWDPHQTSGFFMAIFIWIYLKIFHSTTYIVVFLRMVGVTISFLVTFQFYKTILLFLSKKKSLLLAIVFFNLSAKTYMLPEFSNMLVWGITLILIMMTKLLACQNDSGNIKKSLQKQHNFRIIYLAVFVGVCVCFVVLSYPSCIIIFPLVYLWFRKYDKCSGQKNTGIFTIICAAGFMCYMGYLFSYMSLNELKSNIENIFASNGAHSGNIAERMVAYGRDLLVGCGLVALFVLLGYIIQVIIEKVKKVKIGKECLFFMSLCFAFSYQITCWIFMPWKYEKSYMYAIYILILLFSFWCCKKYDQYEQQLGKLWIWIGNMLLIAILLVTNLNLFASIKYLYPIVIFEIALIVKYVCNNNLHSSQNNIVRYCTLFAMVLWCFSSIFIKGWQYTDDDGIMKNIACVENEISIGPGKGIGTEYLYGYIQESGYEEFNAILESGDNLYVVDSKTLCYLFTDVNIATGNTICTPSFNESILTYWKKNPDRYPDVIAVRCWDGKRVEGSAVQWINKWIDDEFCATEIVDGKYYRYYINRH